MIKHGIISLGSSLLILSSLTVFTDVKAQGNQNPRNNRTETYSPLENLEIKLVNIAEAVIRAEKDVLVNGNPDAAIRRNPRAVMARGATFQRRLQRAQELRSRLAGRSGYIGFKTYLEVINFEVMENTAILEAEEKTVFDYDLSQDSSDAPTNTESHIKHRFTFILSNGEWELTEDELLNTPGSRRGIPEEPIEPLIDKEYPNITPADPLAPSTPSNESKVDSFIVGYSSLKDVAQLKTIETSSETDLIAQSSSLDRSAIVQYIYYYALTPNPSYRNFEKSGTRGGDCTNFVSQALKAGGWPSEQGWYRSPSNWWYDFSTVTAGQSWTWINADYFFDFIYNRPRARTINRVADLIPGDVISVDFDNDSVIDHTMLVSTKSNSGEIYLAYHTNNTLDKKFYDFYNQVALENPNARYYAWSLLSSYN